MKKLKFAALLLPALMLLASCENPVTEPEPNDPDTGQNTEDNNNNQAEKTIVFTDINAYLPADLQIGDVCYYFCPPHSYDIYTISTISLAKDETNMVAKVEMAGGSTDVIKENHVHIAIRLYSDDGRTIKGEFVHTDSLYEPAIITTALYELEITSKGNTPDLLKLVSADKSYATIERGKGLTAFHLVRGEDEYDYIFEARTASNK